MTDLPASIEAYLTEAGFSQTEITVVRKLLEGEALTLRELAAKTGKSTGVLDLAVKKLLSRRILCRETVNDTPKMIIKSLEPILRWVKRDTEEKFESMKSRARDFETFIHSLRIQNRRPEIEYYEGEEGIRKAYGSLLGFGVKEFLHYRPVTVKEEEDPLRAFRVQYFRERHKRGIFSRTLAPDTPLGRRFQSRDAFEYRETQLLKEEEFPITFEKIIAGSSVLCFNFTQEQACLLKLPELAEAERKMFEVLWRQPTEQKLKAALAEPQSPEIGLQTKTFSSLREFFLSRKSIAFMVAFGFLAAGITYGLYLHNVNLNTQRLKEQAKAIAATAAPEFVIEDINKIHVASDMKTDAYQRVFKKLNDIRNRNPSVVYSYIMRLIDEEKTLFEFVADADSNDDIPAYTDSNRDGVLDEKDENSWPGEVYDASLAKESTLESLIRPVGVDAFLDQWGAWISGWAPIKDSAGKTVAVFGVDLKASDIVDLTYQSFKPLYFFFGFFLLFILIRLTAFHRSLFFDILKLLRSRRVLLVMSFFAVVALVVTYGMYRYTINLMNEQIGNRLMSIASTAVPEIDTSDFDKLHVESDMKTEEYQRVFMKLNEIRDRNENVTWVYIMRPTKNPNIWEFVADADSNYDIPRYPKDLNGDGILDKADESVWPGFSYDATGQKMALPGLALSKTFVEWTVDQWGPTLTGSAPIHDSTGKPVAILGIDMNVLTFQEEIEKKFTPIFWFIAVFSLMVGIQIAYLFIFQKKATPRLPSA
ncbi:MAG: hypothetical protein V1784_05740 [bacterium]